MIYIAFFAMLIVAIVANFMKGKKAAVKKPEQKKSRQPEKNIRSIERKAVEK